MSNNALVSARILLVETFEVINASIDWPNVRKAFQTIGRDKAAFSEARFDIRCRGVIRYLAQSPGKLRRVVDLAQAAEICLMANSKAKKPNDHGQRSLHEELAFKSGLNAWDYMVKMAQY